MLVPWEFCPTPPSGRTSLNPTCWATYYSTILLRKVNKLQCIKYNIMDDFNVGGAPSKKKKKKQDNIFGCGIDLGLCPSKKQKNPFDIGIGLGPSQKKETERDSRRSFSQTQKKEILYQQDNKCIRCHKKVDPREIEFDHKKPWASGGRTITMNGRALCCSCHKIVTHETKLKEVDKKRKPKHDNTLFGGNLFGPPPKRSKNNPFGL